MVYGMLSLPEILTVLMLDGVVVARLRCLGSATLVNGTHAELVHDLLLESSNLARGVGRLGLGTLRPVGQELVLELNDVVRDRTSTVLLGSFPL